MLNLVRWLWLFGDGSQSTEASPKHTYNAPGIYTVTITVWDEFGYSYTTTLVNCVYVFDYSLGDGGLLSGSTDFCFKHAVKPAQGQGIMPIGGRWVWPTVIAGAARGVTINHDNLSLVINADTFEIYRIGIPELWTDRDGSYDEAEIPCEAMLPEIVSRSGEHENVRHVETHVSMRSWDEKRYRGKDGYTADGFKTNHELSLEMYSGGEQIVPTTKLRSVIREGDYSFLKEIEARRIQEKLKYTTSCFRTTRIGVHCQEIDHRTPPQTNYIPEKAWQKEFYSPDIWFSRNKPTMNTNRADGTVWSGSGSASIGPDGKASAFNSTGLSGVVSYTVSDFMMSGWMMGDGVIVNGQMQGGGVFSFDVAADVLRFSDGINTVFFAMSPEIGWRHLAVVKSGTSIYLYENSLLRITQAFGNRQYGGSVTIGNGLCFDIRRVPRAISDDAIKYYYDSIIEDGGGGFLP